jgi:polyisoprenoid-binding protein YceI
MSAPTASAVPRSLVLEDHMWKRLLTALAIGAAIYPASGARAQLPPGVFAGEPDATLAPPGDYALDTAHTAVLAKVSHIGYSLSVFRFDRVEGTLHWDPSGAADALDAAVETASISTPVPGFSAQLAGPEFLNSESFPQARFISTRFAKIDPTHARVEGEFTLFGKTAPLTLNVELIGAGKGIMGHPRLGAEAVGSLKTADFGLPAVLGPTVQLVIDAEFARTN